MLKKAELTEQRLTWPGVFKHGKSNLHSSSKLSSHYKGLRLYEKETSQGDCQINRTGACRKFRNVSAWGTKILFCGVAWNVCNPPLPWGNANKLFKVFDSLIYFRLVMLECVRGHCPSIIGQQREIVQTDGMVKFVNLFWCRWIVFLKISSKWDVYSFISDHYWYSIITT